MQASVGTVSARSPFGRFCLISKVLGSPGSRRQHHGQVRAAALLAVSLKSPVMVTLETCGAGYYTGGSVLVLFPEEQVVHATEPVSGGAPIFANAPQSSTPAKAGLNPGCLNVIAQFKQGRGA